MINQRYGAVALCIAALIAGLSADLRAGTDAAAFLGIGVGARGMGMGGAVVASVDDASAIYWNPAALGTLTAVSLTMTRQMMGSAEWDTMKDIAPEHQFVGLSIPVGLRIPGINNPSATVGVGVINLRLGGIPHTWVDNSGVIVRDTFEDTENAYQVGIGVPLIEAEDSVYAGAALTYITQGFSHIPDASASGYDVSAGLLYGYRLLKLALVLNRGADVRWATGRRDTSPLTAKFAGARTFVLRSQLDLTAEADLIQRQQDPLILNAGAEFAWRDVIHHGSLAVRALTARAGLEQYVLENRFDYRSYMNESAALTFGAGGSFLVGGYEFRFDYSSGFYRLGSKNRVTLTLLF